MWTPRSWRRSAARIVAGVAAVASTLAVLASVPDAGAAPRHRAQESSTVWLCRPGLSQNPCESDLTTTVVHPNGTQKVVHTKAAKQPAVDCFYVYPTVSSQPTVNANLDIDPEEIAVAEAQVSRFSQVCRVFAPMYPQLTLSAINSPGGATPEAQATAYRGVVDAWRDYLAHDNKGRGVVFIGHSQGALILRQLLKSEIDPNPKLRRRLVSAVLLGGNVTVATGRDVGGDFRHIRPCRARDQTGCVVAYSTFEQQPPPDSLFGQVGQGVSAGQGQKPGLHVLCVNPASPGGGSGALLSYNRTTRFPGAIGAATGEIPSARTPWVEYPRLYTARCESAGGATWLQITDIGKQSDQRVRVQNLLGPIWGLHLADVNIALGNLVDLVRNQVDAYRA
jgi:hypothetical protein